MDPMPLAHEIAAIERRGAGSDAERRAARVLALRLRSSGRRDTRVQSLWMRPAWAPLHAVLCALAVLGSVLSVEHPIAGLALAGGALAGLLADLSERVGLLRRLTFERATQNVFAPDPRGHDHARVRVVLTAAIDGPRPGWLERGGPARLQRRARAALHGRLPGPHGLTTAALTAIATCCAVRVANDDPPAGLGALQLAPTVLALVLLAVFADNATAALLPDASAPAAVVALAEALDRTPPRNLAVDVVLTGAGHAGALGMRAWVRDRRREGWRAEDVAVIEIRPCTSGPPVWWTRDGRVLALRYHPQLVRLAADAAQRDRTLGAQPTQGRGTSNARMARGAGWPAIAVGTVEQSSTPSPQSLDATIALALSLVMALDAEIEGVAGRPHSAPRSPA